MRKAQIQRDTKETKVHVALDLDGTGKANIDTPIGFLSHMLDAIARHGQIDLDVIATGDTQLAFIAPAGASVSATRSAAHAAAAPEITPAQRRVLVALCRPLSAHGAVASNREVADELVIALDTVKGTLSRLFEQFGIGADVPQNQKRALLARRAIQAGIVGEDDQ
jgi:DNA-binding NarL/FixJ family response regulator